MKVVSHAYLIRKITKGKSDEYIGLTGGALPSAIGFWEVEQSAHDVCDLLNKQVRPEHATKYVVECRKQVEVRDV